MLLVTEKQKIQSIWVLLLSTCIEIYDFVIFSIMGSLLNHVYYNGLDAHTQATVLSIATYAPFITRLFGGIFFTHYADTMSRKKWLIITSWLIIVSGFMLVALPGYKTIGVWVVVGTIFARSLQGFAYGAEVPICLTLVNELTQEITPSFLSKFAPSLLYVLSGVFMILASLTTQVSLFFIDYFPAKTALIAKSPLLFSCIVGSLLLIFRMNLVESQIFVQTKQNTSNTKLPILDFFTVPIKKLGVLLAVTGNASIMVFISTCFPALLHMQYSWLTNIQAKLYLLLWAVFCASLHVWTLYKHAKKNTHSKPSIYWSIYQKFWTKAFVSFLCMSTLYFFQTPSLTYTVLYVMCIALFIYNQTKFFVCFPLFLGFLVPANIRVTTIAMTTNIGIGFFTLIISVLLDAFSHTNIAMVFFISIFVFNFLQLYTYNKKNSDPVFYT
jgi:MFS family permease